MNLQKPQSGQKRPPVPGWIWPAGALLLIVLLYGLPLAGVLPTTNPNEEVRIELALAVAYWQRVDLEPAARVYGLSEDVAFHRDRIYSDKAPGLSLAAVPLVAVLGPLLPKIADTNLPKYWPLRHLLILLLISIPVAALPLVVVLASPAVDPSYRAPLVLITALCTPIWTYATVFFGHAPAALLVAISWVLLLRSPKGICPSVRWRAVVGGAAGGFAVATEYPTALLCAVIFLTLVIRRSSLSTLLLALSGAIIGVLPALIYHQLAFGSPWLTGYAFKAMSDFQAIHSQGFAGISWPTIESLWGVLLSPRRGLFYYSPILLLAPFGVAWVGRREGWRHVVPLISAVFLYVLFAAGFVDWEAGWCASARHLLPIVPLLAMPTLSAVTVLAERRIGRFILVVLAALSATRAVLSIALIPFFPPEFSRPLAQLVMPSLIDGAAFQNVLTSFFGISEIVVVAGLGIVTATALGWALMRLTRARWVLSLFATTIAAQIVLLGWQASRPGTDEEILRAHFLRRIGHQDVADQISVEVNH